MAFDLSMPILVVDDYNTMIRIIRNLLKQLGFENVDDASDGSAALAKMQGKKYGLVISDWNMEPMTGYDLLREVRASPELSQTPLHHDHRGIQDRKRHRREEGRRQQLHRQAVQRRDAEDQDGSGVSGRRGIASRTGPRARRNVARRFVAGTPRFSRKFRTVAILPAAPAAGRTSTVCDFHRRITLNRDSRVDKGALHVHV